MEYTSRLQVHMVPSLPEPQSGFSHEGGRQGPEQIRHQESEFSDPHLGCGFHIMHSMQKTTQPGPGWAAEAGASGGGLGA